MLVKETTRYTLAPSTEEELQEALDFVENLKSFYEWGGAKVTVKESPRFITVEYHHLIDTDETAFGQKRGW